MRRLDGVEKTVRKGDGPLISSVTKLPDFANSNRIVWPPPVPPLALQIALPIIPAPGPNWHETLAARDAERQRDAAKVANYYRSMAKEREAREAEEARKQCEERMRRSP
jgi:type IV secretory pathway VirB10-like protein